MIYASLEKNDELRKKSTADLRKEIDNRLRFLFKLRMTQSDGEGVKPHLFKVIRKDVARVKTIIREIGEK